MNLRDIIKDKLKENFKNDIPGDVQERINEELIIIEENNLSYQYLLAYKISKKVKEDKRIMIDRVCCSSYIAYLLGITFVNPLEYYIPYEKGFKHITFDFEFASDYFENILEYTKELFKEENIIINDTSDFKRHNFYLNTFDWCTTLEKLEKNTNINRQKINIHDYKIYEYLTDKKATLLDDCLMDVVKRLNDIDFYVEDIQDLAVVVSLGSSTICDNLDLMHCPRYREDIYRHLVKNGVEKQLAYEIMYFIATGKKSYKKEKWNEYIEIMKKHKVTDEYIEMYSKIDYLYPKSYSYNRAILLAWLTYYKIYFPKEYDDAKVIKNSERNN